MKKQKIETCLLISKGILDGTHAIQSSRNVIIAPNIHQCEQMERADYLLKWLENNIAPSDKDLE
jgi:hypothetical protein